MHLILGIANPTENSLFSSNINLSRKTEFILPIQNGDSSSHKTYFKCKVDNVP